MRVRTEGRPTTCQYAWEPGQWLGWDWLGCSNSQFTWEMRLGENWPSSCVHQNPGQLVQVADQTWSYISWHKRVKSEHFPETFLGDFPTRWLVSIPSHRENHKICDLSLKYVHQDWASLVADTCATENTLRCTQKTRQPAQLDQHWTLSTSLKDGK